MLGRWAGQVSRVTRLGIEDELEASELEIILIPARFRGHGPFLAWSPCLGPSSWSPWESGRSPPDPGPSHQDGVNTDVCRSLCGAFSWMTCLTLHQISSSCLVTHLQPLPGGPQVLLPQLKATPVTSKGLDVP